MDSALALHRLHFAFTITYHYLFPQLTMGLALLIVILKGLHLKTGDELYNESARFWARIFAINFAMGVVTGIPMEFQFGTNWSRFSKAAGGVIGQTLAMEGVYSFFLESTFLGLFIYGEKILGRTGHFAAACCVFAGSWLSGFFIIATDAWMQHPVGYKIGPRGEIMLDSLSALIFNPWTLWQYLHNMIGSVVTAAFVMSSIGAFYLLQRKHEAYGRVFVRIGVLAGLVACVLMLFPTGDAQGQNVAKYQPATLAAMEGHFETNRNGEGAGVAVLGQPDMEKGRLDNPLIIPEALSFITYKRWNAQVKGLKDFPPDERPDNIPLLYYSFHIMVGLGTLFIAAMGGATLWLLRGRLYTSKPWLWLLFLLAPFPYIANTAGWMTAEIGRQPWLIYGLLRTADGASMRVSSGNTLFTLLGFMGMYTLLSVLFLFMISREVNHGPGATPPPSLPSSPDKLPHLAPGIGD
ncbi:MAG: cytochrome ubiquinol oxidase subunit I [Acidobacteria bacterium]|nr:cytochrome ubiquinol oxidase subunit I [Acidobacteriota bacterium]